MAYELIVGPQSTFTHPRPVGHRYKGIAIHHWGDPATKPTFEGTVAWLTRTGATASVPYVAEAGRVARLTDPTTRLTWHAGDGATGEGNNYWLAIEVNPRWSDGDYATVAELIRDIRAIEGDLPLAPHSRFTATECPGTADLARLDSLARAGETTMVFTHHPVASYISQPWGANKTGGITADPNGTDMQRLVYEYGNYQPFGHDGIDYGCPIGTPVVAPGNGVIEWSGWGQDMPAHIAAKYGFVYGPGGWPSGILVCMQMDNSSIGCYMAHLSESYYETGQWVAGGTRVGLSGNTGRSGGPHCHFSALKFPVNYSDGLYSRVNPLPLFSTVTHVQIRPGATGDPATQEAQLSAAEVKDIKDYVRALLVDGYTVNGTRYPGVARVDIETQRRVTALTSLVTELIKRPDLTAEEITAAVEKGLASGAVTVDINVKGQPNVA